MEAAKKQKKTVTKEEIKDQISKTEEKLSKLRAKLNQMEQEELVAAILASGKTFEEVLKMVKQ